MADEQKTTQAEPHASFKGMPFMAMMEKMMGQQRGCNCAEMLAQMMGMCCQTQDEIEKSPTSETAQKA